MVERQRGKGHGVGAKVKAARIAVVLAGLVYGLAETDCVVLQLQPGPRRWRWPEYDWGLTGYGSQLANRWKRHFRKFTEQGLK